jgi:hypothetical protein
MLAVGAGTSWKNRKIGFSYKRKDASHQVVAFFTTHLSYYRGKSRIMLSSLFYNLTTK